MRFSNLLCATFALSLLLGTTLVQAGPGDRVKDVVEKVHGGLGDLHHRACDRADAREDRLEAHIGGHRGDRLEDRVEGRLCGHPDA